MTQWLPSKPKGSMTLFYIYRKMLSYPVGQQEPIKLREEWAKDKEALHLFPHEYALDSAIVEARMPPSIRWKRSLHRTG